MSIETCPTDVVRASPERLWTLLTVPSELDRWLGVKVQQQERPIQRGDKVVLANRLLPFVRVTWDVLASEPPRSLTFDVGLPFGMVNHEVVVLSPHADGSTRVTFN